MQLSLTLRHRLPKLAALFIDGKVSYRVVSAIAWQTDLVIDDEPAARIDTALAERATSWGRLSDYKLAQAIDFWVDLYDPGALRRTRGRARSRDLEVGDRDDACGHHLGVGPAVCHRRRGAGSPADADGARGLRRRRAHHRPAPRRRPGRARRRRRHARLHLQQRALPVSTQRRASIPCAHPRAHRRKSAATRTPTR